MAGRPKGSTNKNGNQLRAMILTALSESGGVEYFKQQSKENPTAFMTLIGKVLPTTISNEEDEKFEIEVTMNVIGKP